MSLAIKPLLPPPPEPTPAAEEPPADIARGSTPAFEPSADSMERAVQDVLATAEPSVAAAVRELIAAHAAEPPARSSIEMKPVQAVVTESAEAVYVNERRDTLEAPPLQTPAALDSTASVIVSFEESAKEPESTEEVNDPDPHADAIAQERGLAPLRFPTLSSAFVPLRRMSSRKLVIGSLSVAGISIAVATAAVLWARGAVADAEQRGAVPTAKSIETTPAVTPLEGATLAPARQCTFTVRASSDSATVWVDGVQRGTAPQAITGTCGATALVEVRHPHYADFTRELVIENELHVDARLEREKTELTVWSEPAGAEVVYDGHVIGTTPLTTQVNRYEQGHIYFRAQGYEADWRRIMPKEAKKTVAITLKKAR